MLDLQLIFILCAVVVVLIMARYLQLFFDELTKEKKVRVVKLKTAPKSQGNLSLKPGTGALSEQADPNLELGEGEKQEFSASEKNLGKVLSTALMHIMGNIVALEAQHKKLLATGTFDRKLHSSNLINRVKIDYELINNDLQSIIHQDGAKDLAKSFQIMIEHVKHIDSTFQESGLVRDYVLEKSAFLDARFTELQSLANLLFLKSLRLNPQISNDEDMKNFMKKYPDYFKIKL